MPRTAGEAVILTLLEVGNFIDERMAAIVKEQKICHPGSPEYQYLDGKKDLCHQIQRKVTDGIILEMRSEQSQGSAAGHDANGSPKGYSAGKEAVL